MWLEELISQRKHYKPLFNMCIGKKKMAVNNAVNLSKIIFSSLNLFIHIFNMSVTYLQGIKGIH